jgi:hypothetical protein
MLLSEELKRNRNGASQTQTQTHERTGLTKLHECDPLSAIYVKAPPPWANGSIDGKLYLDPRLRFLTTVGTDFVASRAGLYHWNTLTPRHRVRFSSAQHNDKWTIVPGSI